jgi:DNA-binding NarL/FixJ family response regulator
VARDAGRDRVTGTPSRTIRVVVADDHAIVRGGIAAVLREAPGVAVVGEAGDGQAAVDLYARHRPDVALVDLKMPVLDGVGVVEAVRGRWPDARLVILTTYDADDDVERALKAGAKAYLLKDVDPAELVACVRAVDQGRTWVSPSVAAKLAERMTRVAITPREMACCASWRRGGATRRSRRRWASPRGRPRSTRRACSRSSACRAARRRWPWRCSAGWCGCRTGRDAVLRSTAGARTWGVAGAWEDDRGSRRPPSPRVRRNAGSSA